MRAVIALYNESGTLIGSYTYDAWGNCTATVESGNTTIENSIVNTYNPFRYRGYYYDVETSMYYLQSRYYVPAWGRFLNADGYVNANGDLIGFNMYAYCSNNPVMHTDPTGESLGTIFVIAFLAATTIIGGGIGAKSGYDAGERGWKLVASTVKGASAGLAVGGALISTTAVILGLAGGATAVVVGVGVKQLFAYGALAVDFVAYFVAPLFGIEMQGIELEPIAQPTPQKPPAYSRHPAQ